MTKDAIKICVAQLNPRVGDLVGNTRAIIDVIDSCLASDIVVFPELALSGYPPEDLILNLDYLAACQVALDEVIAASAASQSKILLGAPDFQDGNVYNAAFVISQGAVESVYHKTELPNYGVFDEVRVFTRGCSTPQTITVSGVTLGIAICEDIWFPSVPNAIKEAGADALISINASPWRHRVGAERATAFQSWADTGLPHLFVNQVGGQDTLVFDGASFMSNGGQEPVQIAPWFEAAVSHITFTKEEGFALTAAAIGPISESEQTYSAAVLGLRDYVGKNGFEGVVLGLSGGIDSALCAALAVDAFGPDRVRSIMMPYKYTAGSSLADAEECAALLGMRYDILPIEAAKLGVDTMLAPQKTTGNWALADENIQSRLRGVALMAISNATGYMVMTTGNKSEMAVGYATLYGDMCGGYNPIKDMWKTEVFALSEWRNKNKPRIGLGPETAVIPQNIIDKPPSAELRPDQRDSDSLPDYVILDDILRRIIERNQPLEEIVAAGHDKEIILRLNQLLRRAEYKRHQSAPGPKLSAVAFGKDWRYPLTNNFIPKV